MFQRRSSLMLAAILLALAARPGVAGDLPEDRPHPSHVLGATHTGGRYSLTEEPYLVEGARQIRSLGLRVIKLYMYPPPATNSSDRAYPFHSRWPRMKTLVDVAKTPYFDEVFRMPFETIILTVYSGGRREHYWLNGITDEQIADETRQFHELARHLLATYEGSRKTFILSHWEGDWAARASFDANRDIAPLAMESMIRWLNARQAGVDLARKELPGADVRVFHAAEVNRVADAMDRGKTCVVNGVIPHTSVDLVSYSAWDTQNDPSLLCRALDFIARHAPDSGAFGAKNVYIGEFGKPENQFARPVVERSVSRAFSTAYEWGCPYVVYWQVYCNEAKKPIVEGNDDVKGFWLIRPDGTRGWACDVLRGILAADD